MIDPAFVSSAARAPIRASLLLGAALLASMPAAQAAEAPYAGTDPMFGLGKEAAKAPKPETAASGPEVRIEPAVAPGARGGPAPVSASPLSGNGELYGPPAPKSEKGKLPDVAWPVAPQQIPPALEQAVRITTRNYPTAHAARASLRASAADVRAARWLQFPSVSANLAYLNSDRQSNTQLQPQVVVEVPVWTGGRIDSQIRRAKATENLTSAQYVETVGSLAVAVVNTYFQIASLTQREQLLADSIKEHRRLIATMERRVKQEVSPISDLDLARSRSAQVEQDYNLTRAQRQTALRIMAELVADPSYDLGPVPYFDPKLDLERIESLEEEAVAFSPGISRLRATADVARAEMEQTRASILPQLNAQYSYDRVFGNRVGLAVRAQNTGGFGQFSQVEGARLRIDAAQENARAAEEELRRQVAADLIENQAARARAVISRSASETAGNVSASYMRQFIAGRRSWLDVMNALREAVSAQIGRAEAEVTAMSSAARILLRSGRWRPTFVDAPGGPDL